MFVSVCCILVFMPYLYSLVWSCSIVPGHWELSNIQWHSVPPAYNLDCTQSGSQRQQKSCYPYGGHSGAQGPSCTGWHWSVAQLWRNRVKNRVIRGVDLSVIICDISKKIPGCFTLLEKLLWVSYQNDHAVSQIDHTKNNIQLLFALWLQLT